MTLFSFLNCTPLTDKELLKHTDFHSAYKPDPAITGCRFKSGAYSVLCGLYPEKNTFPANDSPNDIYSNINTLHPCSLSQI